MASTTPAHGLRLSYLRHFINEHGGEAKFAGKTTAQVCFEFVVTLTKPSQLSLVDHVANDPSTAAYVAPANWYVSHAWMYLFLETVDSLERFFADRDLSDDAVLWFCVFNNNQHLASSYPFEYWSTTFKNGLASIGNVVMIMHPWNDPIVLRRSWCVFEVYVAVTLGARFEIALARDQEATFLDDMTNFGAFSKMLSTIKSEDSEATIPGDRDGIFALIRAETSFIAVDRLIFSTLSNWIKVTLEASVAASASSLDKAARWRQLGTIYGNLNEFGQSERCFRAALSLSLDARGSVDAVTLLLQSMIAHTVGQQREPRAAWEPLHRSTLAMAIEHLGEAHPTTLAARTNYVKSLVYNDAMADALPLALDDSERRRSLHGLCNEHTADSLSNVGQIYTRLGKPRLALRWLRKAHTLQKTLLGGEHKATLTTLSLLVIVLLQMGDTIQAPALAELVAASEERTLGANHESTIVSRINSAISVLMAGDAAHAMSALLQLQTTLEARRELAHLLCIVHVNLGVVCAINGDRTAALAYYARAFHDMPFKVSAWMLYSFAVDAPTSPEGLAMVREYVMSTVDDEPEAWPTSCMVCCEPIVGSVVECAACPRDVFTFCTACHDQHSSRLRHFCRHDASLTQWTRTRPPRRFFEEDALLAADVADFDAVNWRYQAYEAYCESHQVSMDERLQRTSVPSLNRRWHPML